MQQGRPKMICLLFILGEILTPYSAVFAAEENSRSAYISTKVNKRLPGYVVRRFASPSLMSCSHSCLRYSWCSSTNFKESLKQGDKGTCELNKRGIVSINEDTQLVEQPGVTLTMFLKGCRITGCLNGGLCLFDKKKETYSCSCKLPWSGDKCGAKIAALYNFTTLRATGRLGPDSNEGYNGTGLKTVDIKDGMQVWQVPITGNVRVEACGASGGDGVSGKKGGKGAKVSGVLTLMKGNKLEIFVGQKGSTPSINDAGSGGGGTYIFRPTNSVPILVAGGGGGGGQEDGLCGNDQPDGSGNAAGSNGAGGVVCLPTDRNLPKSDSGSGAGYAGEGGCLDNGSDCKKVTCSKGGGSRIKGFKGGDGAVGCDGGFGGGGACSALYPGGGGGYSGGGVAKDAVAGGGGSYKPDDTWSVIKGGCNGGDGYISFFV